MELKGVWTPVEFEIQKTVVSSVPPGQENNYVKFVCPCDNTIKYYTYEVNVIHPAESIA